MKILSIVGARPQMIKALAVSRLLQQRPGVQELLIHTGQHYDRQMSDVFFEELGLPEPFANLGVQEPTHSRMTARMLERLEPIIRAERPDVMLLYGDTNSTLSGALVAIKEGLPIAHVEAGVRTGSWSAPEESNRVVADRLSTWAFCCTQENYDALVAEGLEAVSYLVGDVMYDVALIMQKVAKGKALIRDRLGLRERGYVLATCHRAETTDKKELLTEVLGALSDLAESQTVVFPMHPRTAKYVAQFELGDLLRKVIVMEPVGFVDMMALEAGAAAIVTDSGGVQKEAFFHAVPCVIAFPFAGWPELVALGHNVVAGVDRERIGSLTRAAIKSGAAPRGVNPLGDGHAADKIVDILIGKKTG